LLLRVEPSRHRQRLLLQLLRLGEFPRLVLFLPGRVQLGVLRFEFLALRGGELFGRVVGRGAPQTCGQRDEDECGENAGHDLSLSAPRATGNAPSIRWALREWKKPVGVCPLLSRHTLTPNCIDW